MSATLATNARRNGRATPDRPARWRPARDELWALLEPLVGAGQRVAVVGAGNCDDLPLTRLASRAGEVHLIDVDGIAARRALRREPRALRSRVSVREEDVTGGAADQIVAAVVAGRPAGVPTVPRGPLGTGGYDVVVGDLLYTQLLYPALLDAGVEEARRSAALRFHGQRLTDALVLRLHASAPTVVHLNDVAGWWEGHPQPLSAAAVLAARSGPAVVLDRLQRPLGCDVAASIRGAGAAVASERWWAWPFRDGVTYLVQALVCR